MHVNHTERPSVFTVPDISAGGQCRFKIIYRQQIITRIILKFQHAFRYALVVIKRVLFIVCDRHLKKKKSILKM